MVLKPRKIGNSTGVILPKELLDRIGASVGDEFGVIEDDGAVRLVPVRTDFAEGMRMVDEIMDEYRDTPRELAN
jgi:putative addiction module antidote